MEWEGRGAPVAEATRGFRALGSAVSAEPGCACANLAAATHFLEPPFGSRDKILFGPGHLPEGFETRPRPVVPAPPPLSRPGESAGHRASPRQRTRFGRLMETALYGRADRQRPGW